MTTTATRTLGDVIDRTGLDVLDHLDRQASVPALAGLQRQGDVGFVPLRIVGYVPDPAGETTLVPAGGVPLVSSGQGGHTHLLLADGAVQWTPVRARSLGDVGVVTVPAGATAYVGHPEHGYLGFAAGAYLVRRQVEQADELRIVAD